MPMIQISIGMELLTLAGVVYSIPETPVRFTQAAGVEYMPIVGAAWIPYVDDTPIKGGFIRPTFNTAIRLKRIRIGQPGNNK